MKFFIVDAFTETAFKGNTAGVILLSREEEFPGVERMLQTAAELKYSETVFVKPLTENSFHLRYFTAVEEVALCGHATIAAFGVLQALGMVRDNQTYYGEILAGRLEIQTQRGLTFFEMAEPTVYNVLTETETAEIAAALSLKQEDILSPPQIIMAGLPDILLPVTSRAVLNRIAPDFTQLAELSNKHKVIGLHAFAFSEEETVTAYCRNFAPLYDIDEEAATGTSNAGLTYYLYQQKRVSVGKKNKFIQGECMNRQSIIHTSITKEEPVRVSVGGTAKILASGDWFV